VSALLHILYSIHMSLLLASIFSLYRSAAIQYTVCIFLFVCSVATYLNMSFFISALLAYVSVYLYSDLPLYTHVALPALFMLHILYISVSVSSLLQCLSISLRLLFAIYVYFSVSALLLYLSIYLCLLCCYISLFFITALKL
jgi:hypothetical protein